MKILGTIGLASVIGLLAIACQVSAPATATLAATPTPELPPIVSEQEATTTPTTTTAEPILSGQQLFQSKGCSACHGQDANGTDAGPALPGHNAIQVKRQARAPIGIMPLFPPDKISNEELEAIAEYIESLEGGHGHMRVGASGGEVAIHHWMALFAIESDDFTEGLHHLRHLTELTEGQHLRKMNESIDFLEQGEPHEAAHIVEEMLSGLSSDDINESSMHLMLALSSIRVEETDSAIHHMEHFIEIGSDVEEQEFGADILELLREGELRDAEHELEELIGGGEEAHDDDEEPHDEDEADHDDDEEPHDDSEPHDEDDDVN